MKKVLSQIVVALVCAFLGFLLTYQFKQLSVANGGDIDYNGADILSEIEILKKEKEDLQKNNEILSEELKQLEDAAAKEGEIEGEITHFCLPNPNSYGFYSSTVCFTYPHSSRRLRIFLPDGSARHKEKEDCFYSLPFLCLLHEYTTTGKAPFRMYIRFVFS